MGSHEAIQQQQQQQQQRQHLQSATHVNATASIHYTKLQHTIKGIAMSYTRMPRSACITSHRHAPHVNSRAWQQRCWPAASTPVCLLRCQASQQQSNQQQSSNPSEQRPIEVSRSVAAARAAESRRPDALFTDPYAAAISSSGSEQQQQAAATMDVIATQYIDESLLNAMAATNVNSIQSGDYRQVVVVGDGMDCRPFRLPWPPGTMLFLLAPAEVHEQAEALLETAAEPPHVKRGCLLRRVNMNLAAATAAAEEDGGVSSSSSSSSAAAAEGQLQQHAMPSTIFSAQLAKAGFRADRLSVWAIQGLHDQGLSRHQLQHLLTEVTNCAAFHSLLVGEIPGPMSKHDAENLLAEAGLLGAVYSYAEEGYGRWDQQQHQNSLQDGDIADRWLCTAQQLRLSLEQMGIYDEWSTEFADADAGDDFIGNFS